MDLNDIVKDLSPEGIPKEVQLFLLMSYFVLGYVYWTFNLLPVLCLFETLKMFYLMRWDGMNGMDGWMGSMGYGISKVSFNFLHTLYVCR